MIPAPGDGIDAWIFRWEFVGHPGRKKFAKRIGMSVREAEALKNDHRTMDEATWNRIKRVIAEEAGWTLADVEEARG